MAAASGMTCWDYVEEHIFRRAGMTGSAFYTRPQWLTDAHLAHPYMEVAGGTFVDAPDLVRFVRALGDGTLLDRPWADVFTGA